MTCLSCLMTLMPRNTYLASHLVLAMLPWCVPWMVGHYTMRHDIQNNNPSSLSPHLIWGLKADTAVAHFPCDILPQLTLQLVSNLACQSALNYDFICYHLLKEQSEFLVCIVWFSGPFCLRLIRFCHAGRRDGISWRAYVETLIMRKPQKEFRHLKITDS